MDRTSIWVKMTLVSTVLWATTVQLQAEARQTSWERLKSTAERYLGLPYVWGGAGLKSFDCSGYIWRILFDNGILIKRTTARKLYMALPRLSESETRGPGSIVFFNSLKHCGIVRDRDSFYHAEKSKGTNLSRFNPYWTSRVYGYRGLPR